MKINYQTSISLPINNNPLIHCLSALAESLFTAESERLNKTIGSDENEKRSRTVKEDGGYKCIHLESDTFLSKFEEIFENEGIEVDFNPYGGNRLKNLKFLDVGCGVGQKVYLAKKVFGLDAYGLELREPFIQRANEILNFHRYKPRKENKVFQANALTFDKYDEYDIIYFYCPIHNRDLQIKLEQKIAKDAKKGTILVGFLSQFFPDSGNKEYFSYEMKQNIKLIEEMGWKHLGSHYYKKVK